MADEQNTHVGVKKVTQKQIAILAKVANGGQGVNIYELVGTWANKAWDEAKNAGLVTDAMLPEDALQAHWVGDKPVKATAKKAVPA